MKKQIIYRSVEGRQNTIKEFFLGAFLLISSWPRMLLEVFIRRSFGERYFNFGSASGAILFFGLIPIFCYWVIGPMNPTHSIYSGRSGMAWSDMFANWWLYFIYLGAFAAMCIYRYREIKREPSVFDLGKYSLSHGVIHPRFYGLQFKGKPVTTRQIETTYEPLFCFACGIVLYVINHPAGLLVMICAIIYCFSYRAMYMLGDYKIMDYLDKIIINESFRDLDLPDSSPGSNRPPRGDGPDDKGFDPRWTVPSDPTLRRRIYDSMRDEDIPDVG